MLAHLGYPWLQGSGVAIILKGHYRLYYHIVQVKDSAGRL